jgi:hypothetical protein
LGRSFLFVHSLAGEKSQARVSVAKLRIGSALRNPWQFAGEGVCGKAQDRLCAPEPLAVRRRGRLWQSSGWALHYGTLGSSQARAAVAKLRMGPALRNPGQFAAGGSCGKLRAGLGDPEACDRQECLCHRRQERLLNSTRVLVVGYIRNRHRTRHIRSFADFLLERLRFK